MIYGIGTDVVNVTRLEKSADFLNRFIKRTLTVSEQQIMERRALADNKLRALFVAKRFAGKEAVVKALGTGFRDGIYVSDVEILNDDLGRPIVNLRGGALKIAQKFGIKTIQISLSDDYPTATAFAIAEK